MPCSDKRLEASREDFREDDGGAPDVDCVLTTGEVAEIFAGAFGVTVAEKDGYSSETGGLLEGAGALARCDPALLYGEFILILRRRDVRPPPGRSRLRYHP